MALSAIYATRGSISIVSACVLIFVGLTLTMIGVGKQKKWRYALVILSIPVSLILYIMIEILLGIINEHIFSHIPFMSVSNLGKSGFWVLMAICVLSTYYFVNRSYREDKKIDSKHIQIDVE